MLVFAYDKRTSQSFLLTFPSVFKILAVSVLNWWTSFKGKFLNWCVFQCTMKVEFQENVPTDNFNIFIMIFLLVLQYARSTAMQESPYMWEDLIWMKERRGNAIVKNINPGASLTSECIKSGTHFKRWSSHITISYSLPSGFIYLKLNLPTTIKENCV